jgi:hypothetical protein
LRKTIAGAVVVVGLSAGGVAAAQIMTGVPNAQRAAGTPANVLAAGYQIQPVATGHDQLENPVGIHTQYGWLSDGNRTEPDQNTYLVTQADPGGPTTGYDYGRHFLIQGHENGSNKAYFTRINLDVTDPAHRITLLNGETGANGVTGVSSVDGSTYDPFTETVLYTQETAFNAAYTGVDDKTSGGVVSQPLQWANTSIPARTRLDGSFGSGGYEGVQLDSLGNVYVVEDTGGSNVTDGATPTKVKQPNSFVVRF